MQLPKDSTTRTWFAKELIDECMYSRESRRMMSQRWRQLFYMGSLDGRPSKYNRCFTHVDKLSSYIFSPADVRFTVEFEGDGEPFWDQKTKASSRYVNRAFNRRGSGVTFAEANEVSLVEGAAIAKLTWGPGGRFDSWTIRPSFFGVLREDVQSLDRQEAFVHSFYMTQAGFARMVRGHPDKAELISRVSAVSASSQSSSDLLGDSYFHEIIAGGMAPIGYTGAPATSAAYGAVALTAPMMPMLAPEVAGKLIRMDELWVWNDDARSGEGDWATIRYVDPGMLIEGKYTLKNLSDVPGMHPFVKVCSNEVHGSFWGRSEMATLAEPQQQLTRRVQDIDTIWNLRAKPPRAFVGFNAVTEERARALLAPGGSITEQAIGAKVDNLAPDMPPEFLEYLNKLEDIFDDVGGFTNILSGEGEPGVRAGVHAGVLLRTSTPRLRDRALLVERQCAAFGHLHLRMAQIKEAKAVIPGGDEGQSFLLSQLPEDATVTVDSHTSSPAFVEDNRQLAFALAKADTIDGETLIEMLHPPREDVLIDRLRKRQEAQAKWAAEHPVEAAEQAKGKK